MAVKEAAGDSDVEDFNKHAWDDLNVGVELDVEEVRTAHVR